MCRFIKLPPWVKLVVTGRPQIEHLFASWAPRWIRPTDDDNRNDMHKLLHWVLSRGRKGGFVEQQHLNEAIDVLSKKSEVRTVKG